MKGLVNILLGISSSKMVPMATDGSPIITPELSGINLRKTSNDSSLSATVSLIMLTVKTLLISPLSNVMFRIKLA